jgi:hypothetical protein
MWNTILEVQPTNIVYDILGHLYKPFTSTFLLAACMSPHSNSIQMCWYAPWPSNCVKCTSGWLSMHIWSLHIFVTCLNFYRGSLIFITCILDFPWPCINSFLFAEHSDILTYHMMSSSDPTTWYWAPYDQHLIILMTNAHGHLLCIIPFSCGASPAYGKLIVFWTNGLRRNFHILWTFLFLVLLFLLILLMFSPLVISFVIWNVSYFLIFCLIPISL